MSKEIQCQIVGRGTPSCLHDSVIYQPDYEGVQTPFQANEPVWRRGRSNRVVGLSKEMNSSIIKILDKTFLANENFSISLKSKIFINGTDIFYIAGHSSGASIQTGWILAVETDGGIKISCYSSSKGVTSITVPVSPEILKEECLILVDFVSLGSNSYTVTLTVNDQSNSKTNILIDSASDMFPAIFHWSGTASEGKFIGNIWDFEYRGVLIPLNEGSGTDIHDSNGNIIGELTTNNETEFWSGRIRNENGLTYSDDRDGVALVPMPVLHYQDAAENTCENSNDATTWERNADPKTPITFDQIGLTGEINSASLFSDLDDSGAEFGQFVLVFNGGPSGSVHTSKCWIKKDNDISRTIGVRFVLGGGTAQRMTVCINTQTGEAALQSPDSGNYKVVDAGEWWIILSENISQGDNINIQIVVYPAHGVNIGVMDGSAQGSCIMGNSEFHQFKTIEEVENLGPIFTDGSAISTDRTISSFDGANFSNQAMGLYCEVSPVDGLIIGEFLGFDIADFYLVDDQANHISLPAIMGQINRVGIVVQGNQMNINVNGTWAADTMYSGILQNFSGMIELFLNNENPSGIRELLIFNGGSFSELKGKIDELML